MKAAGWFLVAALLIAPASGQIDATSNTLYANRGDDWYMALEQVESASTGQIGITPETPQERTLPMQPSFEGAFELDPDGTVTFVMYYTGDAFVGGAAQIVLTGTIDVTTELRQGGAVIAEGTAEGVLIGPGYSEARIEVQPQVTSIDGSAGNLEWYIQESGASTGALFTPEADEGWSRIELPVVGDGGSGPSLEYEELTGESVSLSQSYDTTTNRTVQYNWTNGFEHAEVTYDIGVDNGSVSVKIVDADNETVLDEVFESSDGGSIDVPSAAQGAWTLHLDYQGFTGSMDLAIGPVSQSNGTTTSTAGTTSTSGGNGGTTTPTNGGGGGNGTAPPTTESDDSPALLLPLVLGGLAAIAARRR